MSGLSADDIDAFLEIFQDSDWQQVDVTIGDVELHLSKSATNAASVVMRTADRAPPVEIVAPHIATFLAAEAGALPLVRLGQHVSPDTQVCLLKVMKVSTGLRAGIDGTVREIRATDGALVEGGEVLFLVEPTA